MSILSIQNLINTVELNNGQAIVCKEVNCSFLRGKKLYSRKIYPPIGRKDRDNCSIWYSELCKLRMDNRSRVRKILGTLILFCIHAFVPGVMARTSFVEAGIM